MLSVNVISIVNTLVLYGKGESGSRGGWAVAIYVSWRFGMLTARISAFVMLLIVFKLWFLLFIGMKNYLFINNTYFAINVRPTVLSYVEAVSAPQQKKVLL